MANKDGHRRFGNVRKRESGRYQIRYPGPDGQMRTGPETYARKTNADRALVLIEAQIASGEWTDPERGKVTVADYACAWIAQRPGLRVRRLPAPLPPGRQHAHRAGGLRLANLGRTRAVGHGRWRPGGLQP